SNLATATTLGPPAAPSNLTATPVSSSQITLAWTDNSTGEQGFKVERATGGGAFTALAVVGPNVTSYANTWVTSGTYTYRVRSFDGPNDSAPSATATATTLARPPAL